MGRRIVRTIVLLVKTRVGVHEGEHHIAKILYKLTGEYCAALFFYQGPVVLDGLCHLGNGNIGPGEPLTIEIF